MKNPNGYGSVFKLSGNRRKPYCARKTKGWNAKGYPIYEVVGYYSTRPEAMIALAEYNRNPCDLANASITFGEVYKRWAEKKFPTISVSNAKGYRASYKLCKNIENMRMADIKLSHLQRIVDDSGKNAPMLKKLKSMLGCIYDYCIMHEILSSNKREMVRYIDISKAGNPNGYERKPFSKTQIEMLWIQKSGNRYYSVVLMLIYTGCRVSELLDLKKEDVHLEERWFYIKAAKTDAGVREVPIAEKIVPFFEYWLGTDSEYIICSPENEHFDYRRFYYGYWKPLLDCLAMPEYTPHCARHTCISLLTERGVDERIIKKIVGHKGQGVTETVYTHLELPVKLEAINKI